MYAPDYIKDTLEDFKQSFKCIQKDCDGMGNIPHQVAEGEWEPEQCQFHAEYLFPMQAFLHAALLEARRHASREVLDIIQANESGLEKGYQEVAKKFSTE